MTKETYIRAVLEGNFSEVKDELIDIAVKNIMDARCTPVWIAEKIIPPLSDTQKEIYKCSECGLHFDAETNYCPNCGAKMVKQGEYTITLDKQQEKFIQETSVANGEHPKDTLCRIIAMYIDRILNYCSAAPKERI